MRYLKIIWPLLLVSFVVLCILFVAIVYRHKQVVTNPIGANLQTTEEKNPMKLCGATSCYDLASQGIDMNQWSLILRLIQEAEKQGYLSNLQDIQTGEILKEKVLLVDELVTEQAKAMPLNTVSDNGELLGATELTLGQLLNKAKLAPVIK